tara:strand:- start:265 stop:681 length:417 start_codon:yes stop_codon:yes gene_type:complete
MNWLTTLASPITAIVKGVSGFVSKKQEITANKEKAIAKLKQSQQEGQQHIILTDAEGEAMLANGLAGSWKDEYVTIIITFPIVLIIIGVLYAVLTGDTRVLDSGTQAIKALNDVGIDMPFLMNAVVLSAIGLKVWRKT